MDSGPSEILSPIKTNGNGNGAEKKRVGRPRIHPRNGDKRGTPPGRYNLHVVLSADEHRMLKGLMGRAGIELSELVRRLVVGAAVTGGVIPIPVATPRSCAAPPEVCTPPSNYA